MKTFKSLKALAVIVTLMLTAFVTNAAEKQDSIRVLFIGNSYTHYHKMYNMVRDLAANIGKKDRVKIYLEQQTPGGWTFRQHLQRKESVDAIKKGNWDYVILQEQSSAPALPTATVSREVYPYAHSLDSLIHAYNPKAHTIFYMTWGHKNGCVHAHGNYPLIDSYEGMQNRLTTSYLEMTYDNNAVCAPVGLAWKRVRNERPDLTLYWADCYHPSKVGSYLAANVIFATILGKAYQSDYFAGLDPETAEYIQRVAQETVFENREILTTFAAWEKTN